MPEIDIPEEFREANKPDGMFKAVHFSPMMHTDKRTPDGRLIKGDGFSQTRAFPLPFAAQFAMTYGHDGAVPVGRLDKMAKDGNTAHDGWGWFMDSEDGFKAAAMMQHKVMRGVSIDLSAQKYEISISKDGKLQLDFLESSLKGLTQVMHPAFPDAKGIMASILGDLQASVAALPEIIEAPFELASITFDEVFASKAVVPVGKAAHFARPTFEQLTPLRATREGHVFGHIAAWGECHIGIEGRCITPPRSRSNYSHYANTPIPLDDGSEAWVGQMVVGTKHADPAKNFEETQEWYSNVCRAWNDVTIGEDAFGIWVSGSVREHAAQEDVTAGCRAGGSGHWKPKNGSLELLAVLSVLTEGYPIARPRAISTMSELCDLTAAGIVVPQSEASDIEGLYARFDRIAALMERDLASREVEKILANVRSS